MTLVKKACLKSNKITIDHLQSKLAKTWCQYKNIVKQ